jgi:hypothetical protein
MNTGESRGALNIAQTRVVAGAPELILYFFFQRPQSGARALSANLRASPHGIPPSPRDFHRWINAGRRSVGQVGGGGRITLSQRAPLATTYSMDAPYVLDVLPLLSFQRCGSLSVYVMSAPR